MTENKRFKGFFVEDRGYGISDNITHTDWLIQTKGDLIEFLQVLNALHEEKEELKQRLQTRHIVNKQYEEIQRLKEYKEVKELLLEEVDVFSDKATEHDIQAYIELKYFDNKDAFYLATATKKAIKMLGDLE